jgi:hypothetical protein
MLAVAMWCEVRSFASLAHSAATGLELPATDGTGRGAEAEKIRQLEARTLAGVKKAKKRRPDPRLRRRKWTE